MRPLFGGLVTVILISVAVAAQSPTTDFTLGILRRDAIVVPFATYDGKRWENHWPEPNEHVEVPISLRSIPARWWGRSGPLETWQIWAGAKPSSTVHVRQPDWLQTECQRQVGLRTDYQPGQKPPGSETQPYPKDGLAVSPAQVIEPVDIVGSDSQEREWLPDTLRPLFAAREDDALTRARLDGSPLRISRKQLDELPINIEGVYAFGASQRVYWIEASREYKPRDTCSAVVFGRGFLMRESGKLTHTEFQVEVVPCNRNGVGYMFPLGVVSLPNARYWVAQWSGWGQESYGVIEIREHAINPVLVVSGGSC